MSHKPNNFIHDMIQHAANTGFQRANRFIVLLSGPSIDRFNPDGDQSNPFANRISLDHQKRLALTCTSVTLPGKALMTKEWSGIGSGPKTLFPYSENFTNEITLEFLCSTDFFERAYFMKWIYEIINPKRSDVAFYSEYASPFKLLVVMMPSDVQNFEHVAKLNVGESIYAEGLSDDQIGRRVNPFYVRLHDVYPCEISENDVKTEDKDTFLKIAVKMKYRYADDPMSTFYGELQNSYRTDPNIQQVITSRDISDSHIGGGLDQVGKTTIPDSPFTKFKKILRDIARYSDPKEFRQLVVDQGLGQLGDIIGIENVEQIAQAGQVIDVFRKGDTKGFTNIQKKLIGPLGNIIK